MSDEAIPVILAVDDEDGIIKSLRRLLRTLDVKIITTTSSLEALEIVGDKNNEISLIISDQRMPNLTGVEFLEKAKSISPDTVRILLTGYADVDATINAINNGSVKYYINKPWDDDELLSRVKESLELYRISTENKRLNQLLIKQNKQLKSLNLNLKDKVDEQTAEIKSQHDKLAHSFMGTIKSFSTIIDLRFKDVGSHSQRVASMASKICKHIGLDKKDYQDVVIASYLHDIGKMGLPDRLLAKRQSDFTKGDWEQYKNHPVLGQICVYDVEGFGEIGMIIRSHHENFNGSGFPDGLREEYVPLGGRIIRIANAFDKLAFADGYPSSRLLKESAAYLVEKSAVFFDPDLVKKVIEHDLAQSFAIPETSDTIVIKPHELAQDMILAEDIHTRSGMFLLPKGAKLSINMIKRINKINSLDPITGGIAVNRQIKNQGVVNAAI